MIIANNISKSFGDLQVLKNVNFEIKKGEIVSVVGSSGAGKTTFLQIIGTLLKQDEGEVIINGVDIAGLSEKMMSRIRNQNIGFVFQFHHLLPEFTALENVCIPGYLAKRTKKDVMERATELLHFLNLDHRLSHKPNELSGGEKQRVAIARALINNPSVVLADEPTGNLDSRNTQELYELMFSLREKYNQTFVVVTHNLSLSETTDKKFVMRDGQIV